MVLEGAEQADACVWRTQADLGEALVGAEVRRWSGVDASSDALELPTLDHATNGGARVTLRLEFLGSGDGAGQTSSSRFFRCCNLLTFIHSY